MDVARTVALLAATLTAGLVAGLFLAFACAVMPGLRHADDRTVVTAMRAVNEAILNGWFLGVFVGTLPLVVAAGALQVVGDDGRGLPWVAVGLVCYLATLAITGGVNVPLNVRLARARTETAAHLREARRGFERPWVRWHLARTVTSTVTFASLLMGAAGPRALA